MSQFITAVVKFWSNRQWTDLPASFTYEFKEEIILPFPSIFHLHNGLNTITKNNVSIFVFPKKKSEDTTSLKPNTFTTHLEYARNALKYSRTLLHPYLLRVYEAVEVSSGIYIVTEAVTPLCLSCWLPDISWGLYRLTSTLQFFHETCKVAHNLISPYAVYVTNDTAQWCLGNFDCVDSIEHTSISSKFQDHPLYTSQISVSIPDCQNTVIDRWRLAHIIQWASHSKKSSYAMTARSYCDFQNVSFTKPSALRELYKELCKGVTSRRGSIKTLKEILHNTSLYFNTQLVLAMMFFDQFSLKSDVEKKDFFETLPKMLDTIPCDCQFFLLLPQITKLVQTSDQMETLALCILYIGENIKTTYYDDIQREIYSSTVLPILLVLLHKTNRALRYLLLKNLELYYHYFKTEQIEDIFKPVCLGLSDSTVSLRVSTLTALTILLPKVTNTKLIDEAIQQIFHLSCKDTEVSSRFQALQCLRSLYNASILSRQTNNFFQSLIHSTQDGNEECRQMALETLSLSLDGELTRDDYVILMKQVAPSFCICSTDKNTIVQATAFCALEKLILKARQFVPPLQCTQPDAPKTPQICSIVPLAALDNESSISSPLQGEENSLLDSNLPFSLPSLSKIGIPSQNSFIESPDHQSDATLTTHSSLSFHNCHQFLTPDDQNCTPQNSGKDIKVSPLSTTFPKKPSNPTTSTTKLQASPNMSKKISDSSFESIKVSTLSFWEDFDVNQTNNSVKASENNVDAIKKILAARQKNLR
ncbi:N-terminal kinase-like protein [Hylaeus volcanicus]|uniref:N-terminal kinase-like protein n=1 Tax=Hylaeus volcanicus TaxID=313075 RepID=UPI0023B7F429|nr:N-terminal kinase-like protein [Hylaeus volcanicus]XP_053993610.1 N-terminal kinase-like protein [Hylaeus volcanicus]